MTEFAVSPVGALANYLAVCGGPPLGRFSARQGAAGTPVCVASLNVKTETGGCAGRIFDVLLFATKKLLFGVNTPVAALNVVVSAAAIPTGPFRLVLINVD